MQVWFFVKALAGISIFLTVVLLYFRMLEVAYGSSYKSEKAKIDGLKSVMNWTLECVRYANLITTFDIR